MGFHSYMPLALAEARAAAKRGEVPVGAVIVSPKGVILSQAGNETRRRADPTAHAEMLAIRRTEVERLVDASIWVTLEPCAMCAMAISHARLARLYFGAADPKSGGVLHGAKIYMHPQTHHKPDVYEGIDAAACSALLRAFFAQRRR